MYCYKIFNKSPKGKLQSYCGLGMVTTYQKAKPTFRDEIYQGPFACFDTLKHLWLFTRVDLFDSGINSQTINLQTINDYEVYKVRIIKSKFEGVWYGSASFTHTYNRMFLDRMPKGTVLADKVTPIKKIENWWKL